MDYVKELEVQGDDLYFELLRQASLYGKWSEEEANAENEKDAARDELELVRAEVKDKLERLKGGQYFECRKALVAEGLRPTDVMIESRVRTSAVYQSGYSVIMEELKMALARHTEANFNYNRIHGYVKGLDHKRNSLDNAVKLFLNGYWSAPRVPNSSKETLNENAREKQRELLGNNARMRKKIEP
jgi:hypothetical protein